MKLGGKRLCSILAAALLVTSMGLVVSCSKDDDKKSTTTSPTGNGGGGGGGGADQCIRTLECPKGGWLDSCATSSGCGYYHLSDGSTFNCSGCGTALNCNSAAQQAVDRCLNSL